MEKTRQSILDALGDDHNPKNVHGLLRSILNYLERLG